MKTVISNKEIQLIPRDVKIAKKMVREFFEKTKEKAEEYGSPTFYFTSLIVAHILSQDLIKALTPEVLQVLLNAAQKNTDK